MIATSLIVLAITASIASSELCFDQELIKIVKEAKSDKLKNIATATLLTGDTSVFQRGWATTYFYADDNCDTMWFGYMDGDECHALPLANGKFVRVEYNMDNCDSAYAHYTNGNCEGTPTHYTAIGSLVVPPLTCEQSLDFSQKQSCQINSNRMNTLPVNNDGYYWQLDKKTPGPEPDCSSFSDLDSVSTQYYNVIGCVNFPFLALTDVDPLATAPSSFNYVVGANNEMVQTLHTGLDCTVANQLGSAYSNPVDTCLYFPVTSDRNAGVSAIDKYLPNKCLWDTGCASGNAMCELGSTCVAFQYWSQCQEDASSSSNTPRSSPACFATNNGPYGGQRWGCNESSECCNPNATCGSDKLCHLSCNSKD